MININEYCGYMSLNEYLLSKHKKYVDSSIERIKNMSLDDLTTLLDGKWFKQAHLGHLSTHERKLLAMLSLGQGCFYYANIKSYGWSLNNKEAMFYMLVSDGNSCVGELYYDENGKPINEMTTINYDFNNSSFSVKRGENAYEMILNKIINKDRDII